MKRFLPIIIVAGIIVVSGGVYFGARFVADHYLSSHANTGQASACRGEHAKNHSVVIQNDAMVPEHTQALLCDTLTITNKDETLRLVAFGAHDRHEPYDGVADKLLKDGQSFTITLDKTGTYHFHDHLQDIAQGDFTVTK